MAARVAAEEFTENRSTCVIGEAGEIMHFVGNVMAFLCRRYSPLASRQIIVVHAASRRVV